jgi:hypothetical protein
LTWPELGKNKENERFLPSLQEILFQPKNKDGKDDFLDPCDYTAKLPKTLK